jgi:hypothetical protein
MQLLPIDKVLYSKNLKTTFFAICAYLLITGVGLSSLLIYFFGAINGDNFWLNITGVVIAALSIWQIYKKFKPHPYLKDIVYVRAIKIQLNYIYRKQRKLLLAAQEGDAIAMSILDFSYRASKYVYELDDNTLTIEEILIAQKQLQAWAYKHQITDYSAYDELLLNNY